MTKKIIYLTDLDDTLFTSRRKVTGPVGDPVTTAKNGHHSYMTPAHRGLYDMMRGTGQMIPVTARSTDAFSRVHLDFGTQRAILSNGGVLLDENGTPDPDWFAYTSSIGKAAEPVMEEMIGTLTEEYGDTVRCWIVRERDAPIYLCAKMNLDDPDEISACLGEIGGLLVDRFDLRDFQQHVNGNNLSLTPLQISKKAACEYLIDQLGDRSDLLLVGAGDSVTDLPFMGICDYMLSPASSQIARKVMPRPLLEAVDA